MATKSNKKSEVIVNDAAVTLTDEPQNISVEPAAVEQLLQDSSNGVESEIHNLESDFVLENENPTELQQLKSEEVTTLEAEIESLKEQIKDKQKRIKELTKKTGTGTSKKELAANWFKEHPDHKPVEFITYAMVELQVSPVYASTLAKLYKK